MTSRRLFLKKGIIGGLAAVHQFINIGDHAMISGGSLVRKDVGFYTLFIKAFLSAIIMCRRSD